MSDFARSILISAKRTQPLLLLILLLTSPALALEPWADSKLPVKEGLIVWLDASRQLAAWSANEKELVSADAIDVVFDASGANHHFTQAVRDAQPKFFASDAAALFRFDGKDDHLRFTGPKSQLKNFTAIIVASPRSNAGFFRGLLAASRTGANDYNTGFNIDLGPQPTPAYGNLDYLNVEGPGFIGAKSLISRSIPWDQFSVITVTCAQGKQAVAARLNGKPAGNKRDRATASIRIDQLIVGGRYFSNDSAPFVQSCLDGDIAEVLLFDRVLTDAELAPLESYLKKKHAGATELLMLDEAGGKVLKPVENPPPVQMFLPGFSYKKLPLDLTNINNLRYREDGKLIAVAYDGNVYLLSDTDNDGLEDKAQLYWDNKGRITAPIGAALTPPNYPHGKGVIVASKGKIALLADTDNDDVADKEVIIADGWPGTFTPVDAVGVAVGPDNSVYFGLGCANFFDAYMVDKETGKAKYDLKSERGTILKVSPDLKKREILCTGIRFPVGMRFNRDGDLFVTDQEGATWCPNGNPFDELLHIQPGKHYGFPPRHPKHNPSVIDEPSTFDYIPQHQSTCGLAFNEPLLPSGPIFGPENWRGDALICGESRGKLYRTKLAKTSQGYIAQTQLIASLPMLLIDSAIDPRGSLTVACHSGPPDWGTGPTGKGTLYKIRYENREQPLAVFAYSTSTGEVRVAYDRPLDPATINDLTKKIEIDYGEYVAPGDRFEVMRPGYAAVRRQLRVARHELRVIGTQVSSDNKTLIITTSPQPLAVPHAIKLPDADLAYDLTGVQATWKSPDGKTSLTTTLPHADLAVAKAFTQGSAEHETFFNHLTQPGTLTLRTQLALDHMLRPRIQPGSTIDYTPPPETVTVTFSNGKTITVTPKENELTPVELTLPTGSSESNLTVSFTTNEDNRPRPLALTRFLLPWARAFSSNNKEPITNSNLPELKDGNWLRGRDLFFGNEAACSKCHSVSGRGSDLAADLTNLIHRDYDSVLRDIKDPSATLNPAYIASTVTLKTGEVVQGLKRDVDKDHFVLRGDAKYEKTPIANKDVRKITPSSISMMPTGIPEGLGELRTRDLLTFLLTEPLAVSRIERRGAPPPRARSEFESLIKPSKATSQPTLRILLVAGPKDHGPSEHDYPLWQDRWSTLLSLADNVKVDRAGLWPSPEQWKSNDVVAFFSANNAWTADKGKDLDAFLARGGGMVFLHFATNGRDDPDAFAQRIGLVCGKPGIKFRHGPLDLDIADATHPITHDLPKQIHFVDESYWLMQGDASKIHTLATTDEESAPRPMLWTVDHNPGKVFVCILGHYTWTFDDPIFRVLVLRAMAWTAGQDADRLTHLATIGARVQQ